MSPVNVVVPTALVEMSVSVEMADLEALVARKFPEQNIQGTINPGLYYITCR